jgi:hypothetical protein
MLSRAAIARAAQLHDDKCGADILTHHLLQESNAGGELRPLHDHFARERNASLPMHNHLPMADWNLEHVMQRIRLSGQCLRQCQLSSAQAAGLSPQFFSPSPLISQVAENFLRKEWTSNAEGSMERLAAATNSPSCVLCVTACVLCAVRAPLTRRCLAHAYPNFICW